jgi:serine/threonine protein phosphatase PrpC
MIMSGDEEKATLTLIGYKGGDPDNQVNQDRAFVISPYYLHEQDPVVTTSDLETQRLMGVFDGHAHFGERVSEYSVQQIPYVLADKLKQYLQPPDLSVEERDQRIIQSLEETFVQVDKSAPGRPSGGCTASVILQMGPKLYIANAGDSVSFVVVHRSSTHKTSIAYMSREDKPELPEERERIERMGGRVLIPTHTDGSSRALYFDTSTGSQAGLAMSRSLGDWDAARVGVIPNPIVNVVDLQEIIHQSRWSDDEDDVYIFAVSASDGMMDFVDAMTIARELVPALFDHREIIPSRRVIDSLVWPHVVGNVPRMACTGMILPSPYKKYEHHPINEPSPRIPASNNKEGVCASVRAFVRLCM